MTVKVASERLNSCSGCEISIVDMGERLLDVLNLVDFVHIPALMDHKYFGQAGEGSHMEIPKADVGIISGGIRNDEHLEIALEMRKKCVLIFALGTRATHGGIPALSNLYSNQDLLDRYYSTESTKPVDEFPSDGLPPLLDSAYALDEKIRVDVYLPGYPPHSDQVFNALVALVGGKELDLPGKSVCDTCPTVREGKGQLKKLRRFLEKPDFTPGEPIDKMRCLLEQGLLCMGPVTKSGCGGDGVKPSPAGHKLRELMQTIAHAEDKLLHFFFWPQQISSWGRMRITPSETSSALPKPTRNWPKKWCKCVSSQR